MKETYIINIPYNDYEDFEFFLYEQINYPEFGYTTYIDNGSRCYILDLEKDQIIMITLKYKGSSFSKY